MTHDLYPDTWSDRWSSFARLCVYLQLIKSFVMIDPYLTLEAKVILTGFTGHMAQREDRHLFRISAVKCSTMILCERSNYIHLQLAVVKEVNGVLWVVFFFHVRKPPTHSM